MDSNGSFHGVDCAEARSNDARRDALGAILRRVVLVSSPMGAVSLKWKGTSKKNRKETTRVPWTQRLQHVAAVREPFAAASTLLVQRLLQQWLPPTGTVVEIGAGVGQLRQWLGRDDERWLHTEPDAGALEVLRERFPGARCELGTANRSSASSGSVAAVVGLCVLDLVPDLEACFAEFARITQPQGRVVHFLDLTPTPDLTLEELARAGKVVVPNVFAEPNAPLSPGVWPEDLLVLEGHALYRLLDAVSQHRHPLPEVFGPYLRRFAQQPFDARGASGEFDAISRTPEMRGLLRTMLESAFRAGHALSLPPPLGQRTSSSRAFAARLERAARAADFEVKCNAIVRERAQGAVSNHGAPLYRSLVTGLEASSELPKEISEKQRGADLLEVGIHVFVAERLTLPRS